MSPQDSIKFASLISNVYAFYRQDHSEFALSVWWEAMKPFDFEAVSDALSRHCVNPDTGQFMPKPADVVRLLRGSTQDGALVAWAKVDRAVLTVGTYRSVAFDDPAINAVLQDMGGWVALGAKTEDEWPFVAKEFENRYRGYRQRGEFDFPKWLPGIAEAQNAQTGQRVEPPVLIGDERKAKLVLQGGSTKQRIGFNQISDDEFGEVLQLAAPAKEVA